MGKLESMLEHQGYLIEVRYFMSFRSYALGAILFVFSDSILAISKFVAPDGKTNYLYYVAIMTTYYSALLFFAFAALEW